ncbi:MAG TPA: AI-2E family transporter [Thermomicrobiales bacterium]|jgi:predicted PurR-regulated permease PerM
MQTPPIVDASEPVSGPPVPPSAPRRTGLTPLNLFLVLLVAYVVLKVQLVLVLVLLALLFATVIERPVAELEKRRVPRGLSILAVYVAIIGTLVLAGFLIAPTISEEAHRFRTEAPQQLLELQNTWRTSSNDFLRGAGVRGLDRAIDAINNPPQLSEDTAMGLVTGIGGGVVGAVTVFVMAFYYLLEKQLLRRLILGQMTPATSTRVGRVWDDVEAQVGRWLRGQLILCFVIGTASLIGYGLMGVRFWPLLGIFAGITEAIPIVGPWIGGVPAVTIALTQSWQKAIMVALFVVVLQTCENWILVPRVMRGAVGLSPLTVFVAILAGSEFMSVVGAFLAIPVAAVVQVIVGDYLRSRRAANRLPASQPTGWRWMREQLQYEVFHTESPPSGEISPAPSSTPSGTTPPSGWTSNALTRVGGRFGKERGVTPVETDETTPAGTAK